MVHQSLIVRYTCTGLAGLDVLVVKVSDFFLKFLEVSHLVVSLLTQFLLDIGAVFNLICTNRDQMIMEKIERHFDHYIPEVILMNNGTLVHVCFLIFCSTLV
jgi:hypothetical protein